MGFCRVNTDAFPRFCWLPESYNGTPMAMLLPYIDTLLPTLAYAPR